MSATNRRRENRAISLQKEPTILVAIPTFGGESRIAETLDALAKLEMPQDLRPEICIVDNFGGDSVATMVHAWARQHPTLSVRCVYQPVPGRMNALQMAIDSSSAEWIITIDDDVSIDRNWLVAAFFAVKGRPEVGFCGGPIVLGGNGSLPPWMVPLLNLFAIYDLGSATFELVNRQLAGAGLLIRREAWQRSVPGICRLVGRTKGSLVGGDDIELQRSIQCHGWIGLYVPAMRLTHRVDRSRFNPSIVARQAFSVGLEKCFHRMAGRPSAAAFFILPASMLYDWPKGVIRLAISRRGQTVFDRNKIVGQMLSPFYFIWHRFKTGFKRVEHVCSRSIKE